MGSTEAERAAAAPLNAVAPVTTPPGFELRNGLKGIGGWLILVAIGLALAPIRILRTITEVNLQAAKPHESPQYLHNNPGIALLVNSELIINIVYVVLLLFLNVQFYRKERAFPTFMIGFYVLQIVVHFSIQLGIAKLIPAGTLEFDLMGWLPLVVPPLIWIPYLLLSHRVKVTFVN